MPLIVLSPYSGNPVKVRDQDIGRAIRDEEGRIFYVVQSAEEGGGYYASMTRNGSAKDEERYRELRAKTARQAEVARESVAAVHDATGKPRRGVGRFVLILLLLVILAVLGYIGFVIFGEQLTADGPLVPDADVPSLPVPQVPPTSVPEPAAQVRGAAFEVADATTRAIEGSVGAALAELAGREGAGAELEEGAVAVAGPAGEPAAEPEPERPLIETASGVRYRVETPGHGAAAKAGDYVLIHYETLTPDGSVVDSTRDADGTGDPLAFVLWAGQVIRGWDIGIAGMQVGERRRLVVPSHLVQSVEPRAAGSESIDDAESPARGPAGTSFDLRFNIDLVDVFPGVLRRVTREGAVGGRTVQPGQTVEMAYAAYLDTETEPFDSSEVRGQPLRFRLAAGDVIQGLDLGVVGMKEGERRTLVIPPYLAYGQRGITGLIPPNATLRYELELLRVGG